LLLRQSRLSTLELHVAMRPPLPVPSLSRRGKIIIAVIGLVILFIILARSFVSFYVDWLWYGEVGYRTVFGTQVRTRLLMFALFGVLMAGIIALNLYLAYRFRPPFRPMSLEQQNLERYRTALEPRLRLIAILVSGVLGLFAGITAQARWETWLLWRNGTQFGVADPQFGKDLSYYAFTYPFQRLLLGYAFTAVVLAFIAALVVHYLFGAVRLQTPGEKLTPAARVHLSVLLGVFVLLKAAAYFLDRYGLLFNDRDGRTGASYTDVNAVLPAKTILTVVALICAIAVLANIFLRNIQLPAIALVLLILTSIVTSGLYPAIVQQFTVRPNADQKERVYIARNITATRDAYGITQAPSGSGPGLTDAGTGANSSVQYIDYEAKSTATPNELRNDKGTIPNARLQDPNVLSPTFTQFQQIRNVYAFPSKLDIDRYSVNGGQDYVVAVRELSSENLSGNQRNWINRHTVYTHGNGFVAAAANRQLTAAQDFAVGGLPTTGPIKVDQPRIYYGELDDDYAIVGAKGDPKEFDRPVTTDKDIKFTYDGKGGVKIGNMLNRLAFATYYGERNILLNSAISPDSKIIFVRNPVDRVHKAAPYLKVDGDPYPAVVGGRILWIVDGYTTTDGYPYSERQTLGDIAADSRTGQNTRALPNQQANYIRNSVKATVDAYDGTVTLYQFDAQDPVLQTWMKAYPNTVKPASDISPELRSHFRYPEDLFKVQRELLSRYHVDDPVRFFNTDDFWRVPDDPTGGSGSQPPYYILAQAPGQAKATYQLTSALNALNRDNLSAYLTVSSDQADYGRIRVLRIPGSQAVLGPGQVQGRFTSNQDVSGALLPFTRSNARVVYGNLLTLPVGGGLLYVEPVYVQAQQNPYPLLQKVLVLFGENVAVGNTLSQALDSLFGPGAGQRAPDEPTTPTNPAPTTTPPNATTSPAPPTTHPPNAGGGSPELSAAIADINRALSELENAYKSGDLARIGQAQADLQAAIKRYQAISSTTPTPSPRPSG
jgi:uncharacterized protein